MRTIASIAVLLGLTAPVAGAEQRPRGVVADCASQSSAAFSSTRRDLNVGPLTLVGAAAFTSAQTVERFGGNKFPALVGAGHRVTVALSRRARRHVSLGYGPLPEGEVGVRDGHRVVTFAACGSRDAASRLDGDRVTFWSGFILADSPRCVRLRVWVDDEPQPRRATVRLGVRRCP